MQPNQLMGPLVALGSSSTRGEGASEPAITGYVGVLMRGLHEHWPGLGVRNLGRSGARMVDFVANWADVEAARPSILTILPFTDFARTPVARFESDLRTVFEAVERLGQAQAAMGARYRVFFGDLRIDPMFVAEASQGGKRYRTEDFEMIQSKNAAVARCVASAPSVELVTVVDQNAAHPEWIGDDGHPNDLGHAYLAGRFRPPIEAWIRSLAS
ncbi:MAG: SGNH/GDSL hydrolase family protein [Myxococcota bacterium]